MGFLNEIVKPFLPKEKRKEVSSEVPYNNIINEI